MTLDSYFTNKPVYYVIRDTYNGCVLDDGQHIRAFDTRKSARAYLKKRRINLSEFRIEKRFWVCRKEREVHT